MGSLRLGLIVLVSLSAVLAAEKKDTSSPLVNAVLCPFRAEPWACVREQAGRMLGQLDEQLAIKSQELKVQADAEMLKKLEARGFSASQVDPREKPSSVMQSMEETLDSLTDGVEAFMSTRNEDAEEEEDESVEGDEKKKDKKKKMKKKKMKKKKPSTHEGHHEEEHDDHELVDWEEHEGHGHKHGHKHGQANEDVQAVEATGHEDANANAQVEEEEVAGRSNGEVRGKKKKKKKAIMKLLVLGAVMKAKIEMLLKVLSFHLQLKFFAIAVLGLLINLARFWVDVKKSHHPQKVIYYEHAQHQHHYDDHGDEGWGGYWKRSLNLGADPAEDDTYYSTNHYNNPPAPAAAAAYTAQRPAAYHGASELAYNRQIPQTRYV